MVFNPVVATSGNEPTSGEFIGNGTSILAMFHLRPF